MPGERIDPDLLAREFATSPTPVLYALHRLVGEGMIRHQAPEGGFQVPLATERVLRDLYDWMQRLLVMACDIGIPREKRNRNAPPISRRDDDAVLLTHALFEEIAFSTGQHCLYFAVRRANDRLAPIHRAAQNLLDDAPEEIAKLSRIWRKRDLSHLKAGVIDYHERRKQLVPHIVAALDTLMPSEPGAD